MNKAKELYKKYKGCKAAEETNRYDMKGIVCGYSTKEDHCPKESVLLIAVTEGDGWDTLLDTDIIITHSDNKLGYWYMSENEVIK